MEKFVEIQNEIRFLLNSIKEKEINLKSGFALSYPEIKYHKIGTYHRGVVYISSLTDIIPLNDIENIELLEGILQDVKYFATTELNKTLFSVGNKNVKYNVYKDKTVELLSPETFKLSPTALKEYASRLAILANNLNETNEN